MNYHKFSDIEAHPLYDTALMEICASLPAVPPTVYTLEQVRKLMIVSWLRGFGKREELNKPLQTALSRLSLVMGNPALHVGTHESLDSALVDEARRRLIQR